MLCDNWPQASSAVGRFNLKSIGQFTLKFRVDVINTRDSNFKRAILRTFHPAFFFKVPQVKLDNLSGAP